MCAAYVSRKETTDIELGAEKKEPLLAKKDPEYENLPSPRGM